MSFKKNDHKTMKKKISFFIFLFEKNIEIADLQKKVPKVLKEKNKKSAFTDQFQEELLSKILTVMEDNSIIFDADFTIERLAELVQSNQKYVSQVINNSFKKNFRSFLNSYRIREAQLILSEPDAIKYTIEAVAHKVGFKSRNSFQYAFKEIAGVNPNFYLKSKRGAT